MTKMIISFLLMIILFLGGVLFGIDQASEGITSTRGYASSTVENAVESNKTDQGSYQVEVMGQDFQQLSLEEKEQQFREIESSNFTQKLAGSLESGVKWFYNQMILTAYQLVQSFF